MYVLVPQDQSCNENKSVSTQGIISIIVGAAETILSAIDFTHPLGTIFGITLAISGVFLQTFSDFLMSKTKLIKYERKTNQQSINDVNGCFSWIFSLIYTINKAHILVTFLLFVIKIFNLKMEHSLSDFPNQCIPDPGCARIAEDFNHREDQTDMNDVITIGGISKDIVHNTLLDCIQLEFEGTIKYDGQSREHEENQLIHSLFVSNFFGFVDDMYLEIMDCTHDEKTFSVQVQSALRIGKSDLGVNPKRVADMYHCLNENFDQDLVIGRGTICQQNY